LIATDKAQALIAVLPAAIKSPGMTAAWEQELEKIEAGTSNINDFMGRIAQWVCNLVNQLKENSAILTEPDGLISNAFKNAIPPVVECFNCGGELRRIKGKNGFFWGCRNAPCSKTFDDNRGRPVDPDKVKKTPKNAPACPECSAVMMKRKSKANKGESVAISAFWGCPNYPTCKATVSIPKRKSSGQRNTNTGEG
jgi:DNA topoisomerase-3